MLKLFLLFSMLNLNVSSEYVDVESIEYYQTRKEDKKIIFNFESDYYKTHDLLVSIELYRSRDNVFVKRYKNNITIIGDKVSVANLNFDLTENMYALIFVEYNQRNIVEEGKINFYIQDDCVINRDIRECKRIYKSEYRDKISKDLINNFKINKQTFDKYLVFNFLNPKDITYYSEFDFFESNKYLVINDLVDGYDINYNNEYRFLLDTSGEINQSFSLVEAYYVDLISFKFSDEHFINSQETTKIHFPFIKEEKVYNCSISIESFINIQIDFEVMTMGDLFGKCKESKYCLTRRKL